MAGRPLPPPRSTGLSLLVRIRFPFDPPSANAPTRKPERQKKHAHCFHPPGGRRKCLVERRESGARARARVPEASFHREISYVSRSNIFATAKLGCLRRTDPEGSRSRADDPFVPCSNGPVKQKQAARRPAFSKSFPFFRAWSGILSVRGQTPRPRRLHSNTRPAPRKSFTSSRQKTRPVPPDAPAPLRPAVLPFSFLPPRVSALKNLTPPTTHPRSPPPPPPSLPPPASSPPPAPSTPPSPRPPFAPPCLERHRCSLRPQKFHAMEVEFGQTSTAWNFLLSGHGEESKPTSIWFMNARYHAGELVSTASAAMMDAADTP